MQRKTKLMAAAGAVALLAIGGVAGLARADMENGRNGSMHHMWGKGHEHGGKARHLTMGPEMMALYDANKDGKLTQQEIDQTRAQLLAEFDADKNGTLSLDEFKALWLKLNGEVIVREFQYFDRDGNAQVTIEEYKEPLSNVVAMRDRNGDGSLGPDDRRMPLRHGAAKSDKPDTPAAP